MIIEVSPQYNRYSVRFFPSPLGSFLSVRCDILSQSIIGSFCIQYLARCRPRLDDIFTENTEPEEEETV